ncbi:MAG: histidinol-phosphatase HisJ [Flavobacteriales bacterium]|nr:histidinol-phosphatase HisJ [Flavobacteriales bacterium]
MSWTNYHSHTDYCDGTNTPEDYIRKALALGMPTYGFSSHAPIPFFDCKWAMKIDDLQDYVDEVYRLQKKYDGRIEILLGLEVDYLPDKMGPTADFLQTAGLDYAIGSIHFVDAFTGGKGWEIDGTLEIFKKGLFEIFKGDVKAAVTRYYELTREMMIEDCPEIVGHFDKIKMQNLKEHFFSEDEKWYRDEVMQTLEVISKTDAILEVNTRGLYKKQANETYPSKWVLDEAFKLDIPVQINSDGHTPDEILSGFETAAELLLKVGYDSCVILIDGQWSEVGLTKEGYDI